MMFAISSGIEEGAQKVVLYGPEGIGKSTFAARFPDPLFIDTEGSTRQMDVRRLPRPTSWEMLVQMVSEVHDNPNVCKTLVIDTIDWAERFCAEYICKKHDKDSIEAFGYGKGYVLIKEEFGRLLDLLSAVIERGVNVVLTAHCILRKFERPDQSGAYDRYELKLGNKTGSQISALVKEWSDILLFANYKEIVIESGDTKKKKAYGGERVMYTQHHPAWDAKNRYGLKPELPFDFEAIAFILPNPLDDLVTEPPAHIEPPVEAEKKLDSEKNDGKTAAKEEPPVEEKPTKPKAKAKKNTPKDAERREAEEFDGIPPALVGLMKADNIKREQIEAAVSKRGYFPAGTRISDYPQDFIDGCLIGAWEQVKKMIDEMYDNENIPF